MGKEKNIIHFISFMKTVRNANNEVFYPIGDIYFPRKKKNSSSSSCDDFSVFCESSIPMVVIFNGYDKPALQMS
jgi:hypothetical protein